MRYPTRNHLPVSTNEIILPKSNLNPYDHKSFHNHHLFYYSGVYRQDVVLNSLRDLEGNQERIFKDQHVLGRLALHNVYRGGVPAPPHRIAMDRLEEGFETGERFKVWSDVDRRYLHHEFTEEIWESLQEYYNAIEKQNNIFDMAAD